MPFLRALALSVPFEVTFLGEVVPPPGGAAQAAPLPSFHGGAVRRSPSSFQAGEFLALVGAPHNRGHRTLSLFRSQ